MARRTNLDYLNGVTHVLGGAPSTGITAQQLVNAALQELCSTYPWMWRRGAESALDITNGQDFVPLPLDFGELISLQYPGTLLRAMIPTSFFHLERLRANGIIAPQFQFYYCVNTGVYMGGFPQPGLNPSQIELYPTPTSTVPAALTVVYMRDVPDMSVNGDIPAIPVWCDDALFFLCRAKANATEDDYFGGPNLQEYMRLLQIAKLRDSRAQTRYGVARGGLYPVNEGLSPLYPNSINDPTQATN